jgi:dTDP-4-amino-4,6-dideoxygalactose transaminase
LESAARENLALACSVAERVICLPIYPDLRHNAVDYVSSVVRSY